MRVSKETKDMILDLIADNEEIEKDEIIQILKEREKRPLHEELLQREYNKTANCIMSQVVDKHNTRIAFAIRAKKGNPASCINIDKSTDKLKVEHIQKRLLRQRNGIDKSFQKASRRVQLLEGQISLEEYMQ